MATEHDTTAQLIDTRGLESAVDNACELIDLLRAQRDELLAALYDAIGTIQTWHSIHDTNDGAWVIYRDNAPEMKRLLAAIAKAEGR